MTSDEWWELIGRGHLGWNTWRKENPDVRVDFTGLHMKEENLSDYDLSGANLRGASLRRAWLERTILKTQTCARHISLRRSYWRRISRGAIFAARRWPAHFCERPF